MNLPPLPPALRRGAIVVAVALSLYAVLRYLRETSTRLHPTETSTVSADSTSRTNLAPRTIHPIGINTADSAAFEALPGIGPVTARRIIRYRSKIGGFRSWADFQRIWGMDTLLPRIRPYLILDAPLSGKPLPQQVLPPSPRERGPGGEVSSAKKNVAPTIIDLNTADSTALVRLRGIGPAFARRIVQYRNRLGFYTSIDQLAEVYGMTDSLLTIIQPQLITTPPADSTQRLPLNTATIQDLGRHPYIGFQLARRIIAYREQHGDFWSLDDLTRIQGLSQSQLARMRPYLRLQ